MGIEQSGNSLKFTDGIPSFGSDFSPYTLPIEAPGAPIDSFPFSQG